MGKDPKNINRLIAGNNTHADAGTPPPYISGLFSSWASREGVPCGSRRASAANPVVAV